MICVLDSSVWISALHFGGTPLAALKAAERGHFIAISASIRNEISATLTGKFRWSLSRIEDAFQPLEPCILDVITSGHLRGVCRDPNDDMVIECAVLAKADFILSGDKDLLTIGCYQGIQILTPREFLARHQSSSS